MHQRKIWIGSNMLASMLALVACDEGVQDPGAAGALATAGTGPGLVAGSPGLPGSAGSSGSATGGSSASAGSGNDPNGMVACTNKQHPDHPDKPCSIWKEWDADKSASDANCNAEWLTGAGYCLESCGKCSPASGDGNGSGGSSSGNGTGLGPGPNLPDVSGGDVYWASRYWDCC